MSTFWAVINIWKTKKLKAVAMDMSITYSSAVTEHLVNLQLSNKYNGQLVV